MQALIRSMMKAALPTCRMLGFNAVRVAFAFDDNWGINSPVVDWTGECEVPTETQIRKTLVPGKNASTTIKGSADTLPPLAPPDVPKGICNSDWPKDSTYQRFIWVIDYLISQVCFPKDEAFGNFYKRLSRGHRHLNLAEIQLTVSFSKSG